MKIGFSKAGDLSRCVSYSGLAASIGAVNLLLSSCEKAPETGSELPPVSETEAVAPEVVATYTPEASITRADVDRTILEAPPSDRQPREAAFTDWYEDWVREIFLSDVLGSLARENGLAQTPQILAEARTLRRSIYTEKRIRAELAKLPPISEEQITERFEEEKTRMETPESRLIYHIFRRFAETPGNSREEILAQLESARERVANGENFRIIAEEISDSDSRHNKGLLGPILRGQLPPAAEEIVFSLPEGEVSEPLVAADGAHLFFNENTTAAQVPALDDLRRNITQELLYLQAIEVLEKLADAAKIQTTKFTPKGEELQKLLNQRDPETVIFALGTFELKLKDFRQIVRNSAQRLADAKLPGGNLQLAIYNEITNREILYQSMLAEGAHEDLEKQFENRKDSLLAQLQMRRLMVGWVDSRPELLKEYFRNNRKRFVPVERIRLRGIHLDIDADGPKKMAILEEMKPALESGEADWETVAASVDAEVTDWGWFRPNELAAVDIRAAKKAFGMAVGEIFPPYSNNGKINMFEVVQKEAGMPPSFDRSRSAVINRYLSENASEVRSEVIANLESEHSLVMYPSHFPDPSDALASQSKSEEQE